MGTVSLPLSMDITPSEIFSEMPIGFRAFLNRGFGDLSRLPDDKVERLSGLIASGMENTEGAVAAESARLLGVAEEDVSKISAALGLLIAFTTRRTDVETVLQQGAQAGAIPAESITDLVRLSHRLAERKSEYKEALEVAALAKEVAPSFERLDLAPEIRFAFDGPTPSRSVAVVLCRLVTDSDDSTAFFQLRRQDLVRIIEQLNKALHQVDSLQKLSLT
jgi:hypothetical protein